MDLIAQVQAAFSSGGAVEQAQPHFQPRQGQLEMALAVARTVETGGALVVEAGTGVGKTYAYLVPALLSGERVLLSTATKTLQDQLFGRDLPRLVRALGLPLRAALLKGRASYLCRYRLAQTRLQGLEGGPTALQALAQVEAWALHTRTGDLAELAALDEHSPVVPRVTSTRDNCLGAGCPNLRGCHLYQARREALAADVVVVNHHLFFADMAVRESGLAELLPTVRVAVFDEAHQLNEVGVQFLGQQLSTGQLTELARELQATGLSLARGFADWPAIGGAIEAAARALGQALGATGGRLRWLGVAPEGVPESAWCAALAALQRACAQAGQALQAVAEIAPEFGRLLARLQTLQARIERFALPGEDGAVRWVDAGRPLRLVEAPLDIAQTVRSRLLNVGAADAAGRSWIFTSATLGDDAALRWFTEPCGLTQATTLRVGSPFDFARQAALYLPGPLAAPGSAAHRAQVAALVAQAARRLGGRTLVLTTSLRALGAIGAALAATLAPSTGMAVLVQGQLPKRRLLERFIQAGGAGSVLVASSSFWEGVDLPGDVLQLVVIDKLPFPPPDDPLVEARSRRLKAQGRSPFVDYALAEAAVALRQGAGRLIRRESDRGILVICDPRLTTMGYGRRLLAALPPMRRLPDAQAFDAALDTLTRPSTTDRDWP